MDLDDLLGGPVAPAQPITSPNPVVPESGGILDLMDVFGGGPQQPT